MRNSKTFLCLMKMSPADIQLSSTHHQKFIEIHLKSINFGEPSECIALWRYRSRIQTDTGYVKRDAFPVGVIEILQLQSGSTKSGWIVELGSSPFQKLIPKLRKPFCFGSTIWTLISDLPISTDCCTDGTCGSIPLWLCEVRNIYDCLLPNCVFSN